MNTVEDQVEALTDDISIGIKAETALKTLSKAFESVRAAHVETLLGLNYDCIDDIQEVKRKINSLDLIHAEMKSAVVNGELARAELKDLKGELNE